MAIFAWTALALLLPTAAMYVLIVALRGSRGLAERRRKAPPAEPLDHLEARLRRLRAQLETAETSPAVTAKHHRVAAVRGAYARLGVSPPAGGDRARQAEVYRAEAALREHGLDVREPAGR
jgi:hypothetical protein